MAKKVTFGVVWQVYGKQTVTLPKEMENASEEEIREWVDDRWDDMPLPVDADYVSGSDSLDLDAGIEITETEE